MLNPKMIPGKTYEQLMEENLGKIPIYSDEWTNYNPADPGITILENLSAFQILQQEQMDRVPMEVRAKLLQILGYKPQKGSGAKVYLEPRGVRENFLIPADQRFMVGDISFETTLEREMTASHVIGVYGKDNDGFKDFSHILNRHMDIRTAVFGEKPAVGRELYLVFDQPLTPDEQQILYVKTDDRYPRNPFTESCGQLFGEVEWSCYTAEGFVPMEVTDETRGFLTDGLIRFTQPKQQPEKYEEDMISGYVWKATLKRADYDLAPMISYITGFLFPVVQKETLVISHSFQKAAEVSLNCAMLEDGFVRVFCKEEKGTSYRLYEECTGEAEKGRLYYRQRNAYGSHTFRFDKRAFGYAPGRVKNAIKIVVYNEEMMRKYYLGEIYGYDNQEIMLPKEHVVTDTFSLIAERDAEDGGKRYDFVKPGRMEEQELSYYLYENEGKIVIVDAGEYVGAKLYLASIAVTLGKEGNVRAGNEFVPHGYRDTIRFVNPMAGTGGRFQETVEDIRKRFVEDMNTPHTAVLCTDYEYLARQVPGLCIAKVHAWMDKVKNEVQVTVLPAAPEKFPKLSELYKKEIDKWLAERRLLSTRVSVCQPVYQPVMVGGTIYVKPHYENCREQIEQVISKELDYIHGKRNFGELLRFDKLFHAVEALECVGYLSNFSISVDNGGYAVSEGADIRPNENCLLYPGKMNLEILPMLDEGR
ncbi:MAG: baseplate J/gp47 family protein [Lachnospiraceae bacterium]|nr:baseplate J/gp47 family protein [Lachnospiraceae bacterium]